MGIGKPCWISVSGEVRYGGLLGKRRTQTRRKSQVSKKGERGQTDKEANGRGDINKYKERSKQKIYNKQENARRGCNVGKCEVSEDETRVYL